MERVNLVINLDLPDEEEKWKNCQVWFCRPDSCYSFRWRRVGEFEPHFQAQLGFEMVDFADRDAATAGRLDDLGADQAWERLD